MATLQEWRWLLRRLFVSLICFAWMLTLAAHYTSDEGISKETVVLCLFSGCMMSISVSRRFHRGIQMIWDTPHRWIYLKTFAVMSLLCYMVSLKYFEPSVWHAAALKQPWLTILHEVHCRIHQSVFATLVLSTLTALYLATASGVIFLFWKTSLRVVTIADAESKDAESKLTGASQCGLCQLGLCLDNTCM